MEKVRDLYTSPVVFRRHDGLGNFTLIGYVNQ